MKMKTKKLEPTQKELVEIAETYKSRLYSSTSKIAHLWDGTTFNDGGYPVSLCKTQLYPRASDRETLVCRRCLHFAIQEIRKP